MWRGRKVLKALEHHLTIRPKRHTGHGHDDTDALPAAADNREEQITTLIKQGNRIAAIRTTRILNSTSLARIQESKPSAISICT